MPKSVPPALRSGLLLITLLVTVFTVRWWYFKPNVRRGTAAPLILTTDASGQLFSLDQYQHEYVYLNFWGSWCGPCLAKIPELKKVRREFSSEELKMVHVAVEDDSLRWRAALDRLDIPADVHLLNLSSSLRFFDGDIVQDYGVNEVPNAFLIAPGGTTVAYNPDRAKIRQLLKDGHSTKRPGSGSIQNLDPE